MEAILAVRICVYQMTTDNAVFLHEAVLKPWRGMLSTQLDNCEHGHEHTTNNACSADFRECDNRSIDVGSPDRLSLYLI